MALVTPIFLLLVFGLVEFSRMTMFKQALTDAASAGCRTAALATTRDDEKVDQAIRDYLQAFMSNSNNAGLCQVSISPSDFSEMERGTEITTVVEVKCSDIMWIAPSYLTNRTLRGTRTMKRE